MLAVQGSKEKGEEWEKEVRGWGGSGRVVCAAALKPEIPNSSPTVYLAANSRPLSLHYSHVALITD